MIFKMMILRRKEIVAAALVVLIGMAGYLNWSYQDTLRVEDGESYIETGKKLGEAQLVNADKNENKDSKTEKNENVSSDEYFENAKLEKQTARAKSLEILNQTAENEKFDKEIRKKAQEQILNIAGLAEKETAVENIAKAKGYHNICVFVNEDTVNITVKQDNFSETDVMKLREIAQEQIKISSNKIKVVEIK